MEKTKRYLFDMEKIILFLIFISSMNMFEKYFYFLFAAFILLVVVLKKIKLDVTAVILSVLSVLYVVYSLVTGASTMATIKQFAYPISYLIGLNLFSFKKENKAIGKQDVYQKRIFDSVICVAMGSFLHYMMNMITNIDSINRNTIDIWSGKAMAATGQAALSILALCLFITLLFGSFKTKWKIFSVLGCLIVFLYDLILGVRSLIVIGGILFIEAFAISSNRNSVKNVVKQYAFILVPIVLIVCSIQNNWFGISDMIFESNLSNRIEKGGFWQDSRFSIKLQYISLMLKHPLGGGGISGLVNYYAHDIILDTYNDLGIMGTVVLIIFLLISVMQIVRFFHNKNFSIESRTLVICINTAIFITFFLEPIFAGLVWMFCSFCFFQGVLTAINRLNYNGGEYENFTN